MSGIISDVELIKISILAHNASLPSVIAPAGMPECSMVRDKIARARSIEKFQHMTDFQLAATPNVVGLLVDEIIALRKAAAENERLIHFIEECSEGIKAAAKVHRFGYEGKYDSGEVNRQALEREMGDILGSMEVMMDSQDVDPHLLEEQADVKVKKFKLNSRHQQ